MCLRITAPFLPRQSQPGQCVGGRQERGGDTQTHRLWPHRPRARRSGAEVLHCAPEPLLELPSSVRIRDGESGRTRQTEAAVQAGGLCDTVREMEGFAGGGEIPKAQCELDTTGPNGTEAERHRMRAEDGGGQVAAAAALQDRIAGGTQDGMSPERGRGNDGPVERGEKQEQLFPSFPRPLGISQTARDSHIPTARLRPGWKSGKPKPGFPLSHAGLATTSSVPLFQNPKPRKGSRPPRGLLFIIFQDHSVLETEPNFRIILRLEYASGGRAQIEHQRLRPEGRHVFDLI